jgi:S-adenosylmethionine hydrolase
VLDQFGLEAAVELAAAPGGSRTFEGRDVFAPAAAALGCGRALSSLGRPAVDLARLASGPPRVLWVDRFGNLVTSLRPPLRGLRINGREVTVRAATFGEAPEGVAFLYIGSLGYVEVGVREGRADRLLDAGVGSLIEPI